MSVKPLDLVAQTRKILNLPEAKSASAHGSDAQADAVNGTSRGVVLPVSAGRAPGGDKQPEPHGIAPTPGASDLDPSIPFTLEMTMAEFKALRWNGPERWICDRLDDMFPRHEVTDWDYEPEIRDGLLCLDVTINKFNLLKSTAAHSSNHPLSSDEAAATGAGVGRRPAPPPEAA